MFDSPIIVFISAFFIGSLAGLAATLRSGIKLTPITILSSTLNSGLLSLCISLIYFVNYKENVFALLGCCLLAGLGGVGTMDFILNFLRQKFFSLPTTTQTDMNLHKPDKTEKNNDSQ